MNEAKLLEIIGRGEDSRHQFKSDITNAKSVGAELAAFANGAGGMLLIGVSDGGKVSGLSGSDVRRVSSLVTNAASQNVRPPVTFSSENVSIQGRIVIVISIPPGIDKPYFDSDGVIWQKLGSDKRRVHSRDVLQRLFQQAGVLQADAIPVRDTGPEAIACRELAEVIREIGGKVPRNSKAAWVQLEQMSLVRNGHLTLAGLLLFAKHPHHFKPQFGLKAVYFSGSDPASSNYLDVEHLEGRTRQLFQGAFTFLHRNLRKVQPPGASFNAPGMLEIPRKVLEELLCNAFLHRDYLIDAPIRVFLFDDRIEIISPGSLPGDLTVKDIRQGVSLIRNPLFVSFATKGVLPYHGLGTGIRRALRAFREIEFVNDPGGFFFKAIVRRPAHPGLMTGSGGIGENIGEKFLTSDLSQMQRQILMAIAGNPRVSAKELSAKVGISSRNVEVHLRKLRNQGLLIRQGPAKGGFWKLIPPGK